MSKIIITKGRPSASGIRFTVGRDINGRWIVSDRDGKVGGLFADRASAVHFATFESDHVPGAVWCAPDNVTLNFSLEPQASGFGFANKVEGRA